MPGPLAHIKVLDLSRIMAGPWTGQVLADLGADVIKVERPGGGDDTRSWGPPFLKDRSGRPTTDAGYFLAVNRGKRSIAVDLNAPEGKQIIKALAARSDILLENYKVGTLEKFGLGYADLKAVNPRLIYGSISGFGQTGPKRSHAAYDFMIQAMGGLMSVTGEADDRPGGGPQKVGVPIVDMMTGMYLAVAVLAALERRKQSGAGDRIDIGMLDVQVAFLANQSMNYLISGKVPKRSGNKHPNIQPQDVFACRDGHIALACGNDAQFVKLCEVIGDKEIPCDERFATNPARILNLDVLRPLLAAAFVKRDVRDWVQAMETAGVPCGPINSIAAVFEEPQVVHRGMLRKIPHPEGGMVPQVISPIRFAEGETSYDRCPPTLGQHTIEILGELGFADGEIEDLKTRGVVQAQ